MVREPEELLVWLKVSFASTVRLYAPGARPAVLRLAWYALPAGTSAVSKDQVLLLRLATSCARWLSVAFASTVTFSPASASEALRAALTAGAVASTVKKTELLLALLALSRAQRERLWKPSGSASVALLAVALALLFRL